MQLDIAHLALIARTVINQTKPANNKSLQILARGSLQSRHCPESVDFAHNVFVYIKYINIVLCNGHFDSTILAKG